MSTATSPTQTSSSRTPPWHALELSAAESVLDTSVAGLTTGESVRRLDRYGPNAITAEREISRREMLLNEFRSPLILLLLAAAAIMVVVGEYIDTVVILLVVILNAGIGYFQESQAAKSVSALQELMSATARVLRDGHEHSVDSTQLVPGDLVLLESGVRVPADLRLSSSTSLLVDESLLTGESVSVRKQTAALPPETSLADRSNMVFSGTTVVRGRGRGLVVATGDATQLGSIATEMREVEQVATPLQRRLDRLARGVGVVVVAGAFAAFLAGISSGRSTSEMFLVSVALAVSAIPEGLPIAFTITLAVGVRHMARRNAIARRLPVVETLGSATVIGSDKTGTLTENRMTVQRIWSVDNEVQAASDDQYHPHDLRPITSLDGLSPIELTVLSAILTNESHVFFNGNDWDSTGDPTEVALLVAANRMGIDVQATRNTFGLLVDVPFEPDRGFSASLRSNEDDRILFVKGAPERLLAACSTIESDDGPVPIDRAVVNHAARRMAVRGERVLAMAYRMIPESAGMFGGDELPETMTFLGLQGMTDPARPGTAEAISKCNRAGVRTIMITGDNQTTAAAIASQLGIGNQNAATITGAELASLGTAELDLAVQEIDIFARVSPQQKLQIVQALQRAGEVVAVTGDGVNDAPALRAADIGVAMGKRGTDVAKEAADMILADDNFVSIVAAIEEGRTTYQNVRKVVSFLFTTNAAEVLIIVASLLLDWPLPLIAVQILWLNLVTDSLQVMALAFEPAEPDVMHQPPLGRTAGILTRALWQRVALCGVVMTIGTLLLFRWELDNGAGEKTAQTIALTTMVLFQMLQALNSRSERRSLLHMPLLQNRYLMVAVTASLTMHAAALYLPPTQYLLRVEPLSLTQWAAAVLVSLSILMTVELHKWVLRSKASRTRS